MVQLIREIYYLQDFFPLKLWPELSALSLQPFISYSKEYHKTYGLQVVWNHKNSWWLNFGGFRG